MTKTNGKSKRQQYKRNCIERESENYHTIETCDDRLVVIDKEKRNKGNNEKKNDKKEINKAKKCDDHKYIWERRPGNNSNKEN
jgi:hypothetical protein